MVKWRVAIGAVAVLIGLVVGFTPAAAELRVNIGGYVKLDTAYQDQMNNGGQFRMHPDPGSIVFDKGAGRNNVRAGNDQFLIEARESRFHLTATDRVGNVDLKGFIQLDFYGGNDDESSSLVSNSHQPRLRHAWAEGRMPVGGGSFTLMFGQNWSTFMNTDVGAPETIDFNGPAGQLFARQPQLRLTYGLPYGKNTLNLIGAVQAQSVNFTTNSDVDAPLAVGVSPARQEGQTVPAFVGKVQWLSSVVNVEGGVIFSEAKGIGASGGRESAGVWGLQASANVPLGPLTLHFHVDRLNGITREANGDFPDAVFKGVGNDVATITTTGFYLGGSYNLTPNLGFNGAYGRREADDSGASGFGRGGGATTTQETQQSIHLNALYKFWGRMRVGAEFERMWVEAFSSSSGSNNIYRVALWYFF